MKKVAIVIPFHKTFVSKDEEISIKHLVKYLGKFDKFLVLPNFINKVSFKIRGVKKIINFPNEYFTSVPKYCEMLNSRMFYEQFTDYEYILIYQLDVLVFSNNLLSWCKKGYDYIGAPFFNPIIGRLSHSPGHPVFGGNGGFSLRKVASFLKVIDSAERLAGRNSSNPLVRKLWFIIALLVNQTHKKWLNAIPQDYPFNEDGFWSYEAPKYYSNFKVAPLKEALQFSFEKFPRKCFELNGGRLPFGCHAWQKYDEQFWKPYLGI